MTTSSISPLRQRMIDDMNARKLNRHTQRSHLSSCKRFAVFLKRSPDTATADDVRSFQLHVIESGASIGNRNRIMSGVKFLLRVTLRRHDLAAGIYHIKEPIKLPLIMSRNEAEAAACHGRRSQDQGHAGAWLWLRPSGWGDRQAQSRRHRWKLFEREISRIGCAMASSGPPSLLCSTCRGKINFHSLT